MSQSCSYTDVTSLPGKRKPVTHARLKPMASPPQRTPRLAPEIRREQLLDAALDVLTEGGFDAVTVEAVARRAGVTRPVVYNMFGDLNGLMVTLIDREERAALAPLLDIVGVGGDRGEDVDREAVLM